MKLIAIILTFASIAQAGPNDVYVCGGSRIVENEPGPGIATIYRSDGSTSKLQFTETRRVFPTHVGTITETDKVYFHPFYEFRLKVITEKKYGEVKTTITASYLSEMNPTKQIACVKE